MVVVQKGDHSLGYYDFETGQELGRVAVDPFPHEFTLSADKRTAYLAGFGVALAEHPGDGGHTVSVVDVPGVGASARSIAGTTGGRTMSPWTAGARCTCSARGRAVFWWSATPRRAGSIWRCPRWAWLAHGDGPAGRLGGLLQQHGVGHGDGALSRRAGPSGRGPSGRKARGGIGPRCARSGFSTS